MGFNYSSQGSNMRAMAQKTIALTTDLHEQIIFPNSNKSKKVRKKNQFFLSDK